MAQITAANILNILSTKWHSLNEIVFKLQIDDVPDTKYLELKLKDLISRKKIIYLYYDGEKYWKSIKLEDLHLKLPNNLVGTCDRVEYIEKTIIIDFYIQLIDNNPTDIDSWKKLASYYKDIDSSKENLCLERIIDLDPFDEETWQYLAFKYIKERNIDDGIEYLKSAYRLASDESDPDFNLINLKVLGFLYFNNGDYQNALKHYEAAFELGWKLSLIHI